MSHQPWLLGEVFMAGALGVQRLVTALGRSQWSTCSTRTDQDAVAG